MLSGCLKRSIKQPYSALLLVFSFDSGLTNNLFLVKTLVKESPIDFYLELAPRKDGRGW